MSDLEKDKSVNEIQEYTDQNILLSYPVPIVKNETDNYSPLRKFLNDAKKPNIVRQGSIGKKTESEATFETDLRSMSLPSMYENGSHLSNDMDTVR